MRKIMYAIIGITLILVGISAQIIKIGYLDEQGWQSSETYPIGLMGIIWGALFCIVLWFKKLLLFQHPVLWIVGIVPLVSGLYIIYMMGGI